MLVQRIKKVEVRNVKGLESADYPMNLMPNKPTLIVAPNGTGKTSTATAFKSLKRSRLELEDEHLRNGNVSFHPSLCLICEMDDGTVASFTADQSKNEISSQFDIYVISSMLRPKASKRKINGQTIAIADIETQPIVLVAKIPDKLSLAYSYASEKASFGQGGKALQNLSTFLDNPRLVIGLMKAIDFSKARQVGTRRKIDAFHNALNGYTGTAAQILSQTPKSVLDDMASLTHILQIRGLFADSQIKFTSEAAEICAANQLEKLYHSSKSDLRALANRYEYEAQKSYYEREFLSLRTTWKNVKPREDKKRGLVIDFPKSGQISNGERDTLCFVAALLQARQHLNAENCLLLIDEIFDYLDDANVVSCQYYISRLISEFKASGRRLYTMIFTHLDPSFFKSFVFKDQKVYFLNKRSGHQAREVEKIIFRRDDVLVAAELSEKFMHFHPVGVDLSLQFTSLSLPTNLARSQDFTAHVEGQVIRYISGQVFDSVAVCCGLRLGIEKKIYELLDPLYQSGYLATHKTREKLDFASDHGVDVPDVMYLLGVIYNEAMHLRSTQDYISPIRSKLENLTIKQMVTAALH